MSEIQMREELMELMYMGVDHGVDSIKDSGGPLIPFALIMRNDEVSIQRFVSDRIEKGVEIGKNYIKNELPKPDLAVLVFESYVTMDDQKYDSISVEGFDVNDPNGHIFIQRFKPKKFLSKFKTIGNVAYFGTMESLLT